MTPSTAEPTHTAPAPTTALVRPAEPTGPSAHFFSRRPHPTAGIPPRPTRRRAPPSVLRLLLALLLAPASSALAAAAAPIPPALHNLHLHTAPNPALDAARQLYAEGRYADAASAFEQIYRTTGDTAALFNAGMAREAAGAGHETHAIYDWLRYLELTPSAAEEERLDLQRRIAAAQAHTTPVELLYNAAPDGPEPTHIKLFFTAKGSPGPAATDPLIFQILPDSYSKTPVIRAHLALGDWTAESYSGAQRLHEQPFTLTEQTTTPQLIPIAPPQPQPNPDPDPIDPPTPKPPVKKQKEPRLRLALTLTTGLTSAALLGTGLGLTLHGYNEFKEHTGDLNNPDRINAVDRLLTDTRTYWTGIGLLGGGLGSGLVAIGEAATPHRHLREVHITEFALGGALTVASAIVIPALKRDSVAVTFTPLEDLTARRDDFGIRTFYFTLGVGAGMATAALITSVTRHLMSRRHGRPSRVSLEGSALKF